MNLSPVKPCKNGHLSARRKSGNCIQCEKDRYKNDPKRREYIKQKQAERRQAIKADPEKHAEHRAYMKRYNKENRQKLSQQNLELYRKNNVKIRLQRKGIEPTQELISLVENHCGKCDICGGTGDGRWGELNIDHCHDTNDFRGMLCSNCNRALGFFKDDTDLLYKAVKYLEDSRQYRKTLHAEGSFTDVEGASKILANAIAGNYDAPKRRVEILDRQQNIKIHDLSSKPTPKKPTKKKTKAQAKALNLDELENKDQAPAVNPRKIIKKVATLSRKEQAQELYQKFSVTRDPELASKLVDLKKTSKVSWKRLGLTNEQGRDVMNISEGAIPPPCRPSKALSVKKVATQSNQPKSLKERAQRLYVAMLMAGDSIVAGDMARQLLVLKKSSKKSWSYLGLTQEQAKNVQDTSKK